MAHGRQINMIKGSGQRILAFVNNLCHNDPPFDGVANPGAITLFFGAVSVETGVPAGFVYSNNKGW